MKRIDIQSHKTQNTKMKAETITQIQKDIDFLLSDENENKFDSLKEAMSAIGVYLFGLAQHNVITSAEFKLLSDMVLIAFDKVLKTHKDEEEDE